MTQKKIVLAGEYEHRVNLLDDVYSLETLSGTQQNTVMLCAVERLPAKVQIEQRTHKGTVYLQIGNARFIINQRAKVQEQYEII